MTAVTSTKTKHRKKEEAFNILTERIDDDTFRVTNEQARMNLHQVPTTQDNSYQGLLFPRQMSRYGVCNARDLITVLGVGTFPALKLDFRLPNHPWESQLIFPFPYRTCVQYTLVTDVDYLSEAALPSREAENPWIRTTVRHRGSVRKRKIKLEHATRFRSRSPLSLPPSIQQRDHSREKESPDSRSSKSRARPTITGNTGIFMCYTKLYILSVKFCCVCCPSS